MILKATLISLVLKLAIAYLHVTDFLAYQHTVLSCLSTNTQSFHTSYFRYKCTCLHTAHFKSLCNFFCSHYWLAWAWANPILARVLLDHHFTSINSRKQVLNLVSSCVTRKFSNIWNIPYMVYGSSVSQQALNQTFLEGGSKSNMVAQMK